MPSNLYRVVRDTFIEATNGDFLNFQKEDQESMIANVINGLPRDTYIALCHASSDGNGKPVLRNEKYYTYRCPCCDKVVYPSEHYCSNCGQKIDWRIYKKDQPT